MLRRIGLSLGLLVTLVVMLPFANSTAHNLRSQLSAPGRHFRHHSRAWWRRHRALLRRRQAMIARRRALEAQSRTVVKPAATSADNHASLPAALAFPESVYHSGAVTLPLPNNWSSTSADKSTSSFRIVPPDGAPEAQATLAVVAAAPAGVNQPITLEQKRMVGGIAFSDLRRSVIDKMITAGGWVVNDRQRDIGGHRVFEVVAQTPAASDGKGEQVWNFYFTEINGRVYSLTTRSAGGATQRVTSGAEQLLSNFRPLDSKR
jgi:hypothetical protein